MADSVEEGLDVLDRLISEAEARRDEQMLRLADLEAEDQPTDEAEQALQTIEGLLASMRARRTVMLAQETLSQG